MANKKDVEAQRKNAELYKRDYADIIRREVLLKSDAAKIKAELDEIKDMKKDFIEVFGYPMNDDIFHDVVIEVDDTFKVDAEKVKKAFPDNWAKRFGKLVSGYSYIQTKLTNQAIEKL